MPDKITYPTLRYGSSGEMVTMLQDILSKNGSSLAIDGKFGNGTRSAVQAFQKRNGLDADGVVGPKTWAALLATQGVDKSEPTMPAAEENVETVLTMEEKVELLWAAYQEYLEKNGNS